MKQFVLAGATGSGKTTFVKDMLSKIDKPKFVYDVNNEYKDFCKIPFTDIEKFTQEATKKTNTVIVFEEASIFFSHVGATKTIKEIMVRKRHTGNILIFNFHAMRQIPFYILDFTDFLIIKKTVLDSIKRYEQRTEIIDAYETVKRSKNPFEMFVLNLRPKIE